MWLEYVDTHAEYVGGIMCAMSMTLSVVKVDARARDTLLLSTVATGRLFFLFSFFFFFSFCVRQQDKLPSYVSS